MWGIAKIICFLLLIHCRAIVAMLIWLVQQQHINAVGLQIAKGLFH